MEVFEATRDRRGRGEGCREEWRVVIERRRWRDGRGEVMGG